MSKEVKKRIFLISLGCSKNLVDSEHILGVLDKQGFYVVSDLEEADISIINTCGFILEAVEESIDAILESVDLKKKGLLEMIVVTGCFVQRYGYKLQREIKEVDAWLGTGQAARITDVMKRRDQPSNPFIIEKPLFLQDHTFPRILTTPFYSAYIKIAEGCSSGCTYCVIPRLRGPFRSREPDSIIREAAEMAGKGVREINLIAQDSGVYGEDLSNGINLEYLLEKLVQVKDIKWIRIHYCNPDGVNRGLLNVIEREEKVCAYFDIPLQHVNRDILSAMGRDPKGEDPGALIEEIRSIKRFVNIRTTFMVGFPGETDDIFSELYRFVEKYEFDHMGAFIFSPEKGTRAGRLSGLIDKEVAGERLDALMRLQAEISRRKNQRLVGQTLPVLIEGYSEETEFLLRGRTSLMAPDVDGQVLINKGRGEIGEIMPVRITEAYEYDLIGEIVEKR